MGKCVIARLAVAAAAMALGMQPASASELFETPAGTNVRSLLDWEGTSALEVFLQGVSQTIQGSQGVADYTFAPADLCQRAAYRAIAQADGSAAGALVDLSPLCHQANAASLTFAFISDTQKYQDQHEKVAQVLSGLIDSHPDMRFVLNGGDLVQSSSTDTEWQQYRAIAQKYYSSRIPLVPVVGNHDYRGDAALGRFNKLYAAPTTSAHYYLLDFGTLDLIVLDSNIDRLSADTAAAQTAWLGQTLQAISGSKPILVAFHHPAYSSGVAHLIMPGPPKYVQQNWLPLFQQYGVKLVLNGHEHVYERLNVDGLEHLLAGPAGGKMGLVNPFHSKYSQVILSKTRTVSLITVTSAGQVTIHTYESEAGNEVDTYSF